LSFLEIVGLISGFASISGVTVKNLIKTPHKSDVAGFIADLETRAVLWAEIDLEVKQGVIASMEQILHNSRSLHSKCANDASLKKVISNIIKVTKAEISNIRSFDDATTEGRYKIFMSLQKFRTEMAKTLSMLCGALNIEPNKTELKSLITNMATVRPRT
jgi:hypothetical protein